MLLPGIVRIKSIMDAWAFLLLGAIFGSPLLWFLQFAFFRAFGTELVVAAEGKIVWVRKAAVWIRTAEIAERDISEIQAVTKWWDYKSGYVQVLAKGRVYRIGDRLVPEETKDIADSLRAALRH